MCTCRSQGYSGRPGLSIVAESFHWQSPRSNRLIFPAGTVIIGFQPKSVNVTPLESSPAPRSVTNCTRGGLLRQGIASNLSVRRSADGKPVQNKAHRKRGFRYLGRAGPLAGADAQGFRGADRLYRGGARLRQDRRPQPDRQPGRQPAPGPGCPGPGHTVPRDEPPGAHDLQGRQP